MENLADWGGVGVAVLSFCVSISAAAYAKASANAARHANSIQLHAYQRQILIDLMGFMFYFRHHAILLEYDKLDKIRDSALTSKLYLSPTLAGEIVNFYELCQGLAGKVATMSFMAENKALYVYDVESKEEGRKYQQELHRLKQLIKESADPLVLKGGRIVEGLEREINVINPPKKTSMLMRMKSLIKRKT